MMEIERVDLHNSCRSCLSSGNNLESIFECYYNDIPLSQILMGCFPLVIAESDGLSTKICEQCRLKVLSAHEFFQMFNNSEREIREWLKNESEVPEEEEPLIDDKASVDNSVTANNIEVLSFPSEKPDPKIERSPTKSLNHECEICSKKFPSPSKLSRHMRIHEKPYENTTKKFHCEICLKRFVCQAKVKY